VEGGRKGGREGETEPRKRRKEGRERERTDGGQGTGRLIIQKGRREGGREGVPWCHCTCPAQT